MSSTHRVTLRPADTIGAENDVASYLRDRLGERGAGPAWWVRTFKWLIALGYRR